MTRQNLVSDHDARFRVYFSPCDRTLPLNKQVRQQPAILDSYACQAVGNPEPMNQTIGVSCPTVGLDQSTKTEGVRSSTSPATTISVMEKDDYQIGRTELRVLHRKTQRHHRQSSIDAGGSGSFARPFNLACSLFRVDVTPCLCNVQSSRTAKAPKNAL